MSEAKQSDSGNMPHVLLTGATGAIGGAIARGLAKEPFVLHLTARNQSKGAALVKSLKEESGNSNIHLELVDLSNKASTLEFTERFKAKVPELSILLNNAAIPAPSSLKKSDSNLELQLHTNVYSYYLLMTEFHGILKKGAPSRIINVASNYAGDVNLRDLNFESRQYSENAAYRQSKAADRMISWAAADKWKNDKIAVYACHPGVVTSNALTSLGMSSGYESPEKAASTPLYLALANDIQDKTGTYWVSKRKTTCSYARDKKSYNALWQYFEEI